jgi:2-C-methyl-D-erythritol 4-phosphate cytidylyltransferase
VSSPRIAVIIAAAGAGERMGGVRKQYLLLNGRPLLSYSLERFLSCPGVQSIVVALPSNDVHDPPVWLRERDARVTFVAGGNHRGESVFNALRAIPEDSDIVLVHDAARPLVSESVIARVVAEATLGRGAVPAMPVSDTIKRVGVGLRIEETPDRSKLWRAQTPQGFPVRMLLDAYERAAVDGVLGTDDSTLVERMRGEVVVVQGARENIKITTPEDIAYAEALLSGAH